MNDFLLFIDANKYLDLYRIEKGKVLLKPLLEQKDHIFVTQQICNEVQRNKISVAAEFFKKQLKQMKLQTFNLPDHLSSSSEEQRNAILAQMRDVKKNIEKINEEVDNLGLSLMRQISRSEDEVSKALHQIFENKVTHTSEELQKARDRRELGNPPGKKNDPIGDQLTWEQILTHFSDKKRLWIISRDYDYATIYGKETFLNHFLYDELCNISFEPEVYFFEDLVKGLNHFIDTTGVNAENRLTPEEVEEIEREEESLSNNFLLQRINRQRGLGIGIKRVSGQSPQLDVDIQNLDC